MSFIPYYGLRCPIYGCGWFCQCLLGCSILWLSYFHVLLKLIMINAHTSVSSSSSSSSSSSIIIIIIVITIISFMQGIFTYIPETNYVPKEYSVAAILLFLFMVLISLVSVLNLLYFYISTFRRVCSAQYGCFL